jgi:hypothetical protein
MRQPVRRSAVRRSDLRWVGMFATALALLAWPIGARAADTLEVIEGDKTRTVALASCSPPERIAGQAPGFAVGGACGGANRNSPRFIGGEVTLLVRNTTAKKAKLAISYVADAGAAPIAIPGSSRRVYLAAEGRRSNAYFNRVLRRAGASMSREALRRMFRLTLKSAVKRTLWIGPGGIRAVSIGFRLRPGEAAGVIDGNLVLRLSGGDQVVPLEGQFRSFDGVEVEPANLTLHSEEEATVSLVGPEVVQFLRFGSIGRRHTATLRDDSDDSVEAEVVFPRPGKVAAQENPNRAEGTLTLSDSDLPSGEYKGKVVLSDFSPGAPALEVDLLAGRSFWWLFGCALLGVVSVGLASRMTAFALRRRLLLKVLKQSRDAYELVDETKEGTASWDLGDLLGPQAEGEGRRADEHRLQGAQGLQVSIETARSRKDLDEDTERTLKLVARIQRWLRVEPAARRLRLVDGRYPEGEEARKAWMASHAWRDTQLLREAARRELPSAEAADALVERLLRQASWHRKFAEAWKAADKTSDPKDKLKAKSIVRGLERALGAKSTVLSRTPEDQDALDQQLDQALGQLEITVDRIPAIEEPKEEFGVTGVDWDASPFTFTGWATLDGESYGQLASIAARGARRLGCRDVKIELRSITWGDAFWSGVSLGLVCIVYGTEKYSDTWGSREDLIAAFVAGATGVIVVHWAALPLFQSIRLRAAKKADSPPDSPPAGDEGGSTAKKDLPKAKVPSGS